MPRFQPCPCTRLAPAILALGGLCAALSGCGGADDPAAPAEIKIAAAAAPALPASPAEPLDEVRATEQGARTPEAPKPAAEGAKDAPARDVSLGGLADGDAATTGSIEGVAVFAGDLAKLKAELPALTVKPGHKDGAYCGASIPNQKIVLGEAKEGRSLANVVVNLAKVPGAPKPTLRDVELANVKCIFEPHVLATTKGSSLIVSTKDEGIFHSAHGYLGNEFNKAITSSKTTLKERLRRSGWTLVKCDGHEWMEAHLWVFDHDFFAITGKDGRFKLQGVPAGDYELEIWHERLAIDDQKKMKIKVSVAAGKTSEVPIELKLE